jgi:hypothetical protein
MRVIEQLVYKIGGDTKEFDSSLDKSGKNVNKFGSTAKKIFAGVTVAAVAMTIKKLGDLAIQTSTALDRIDKMSQKIGVSREAFQEWDFILSQSGASVEGLQMGVKTLSNAAAEARDGTKEYKDEFDKLGVSVTDVNGNMKDQEELFNEVFIALSNTENQTERTAIANRLLGRSATELSPAFNAGGDAIEGMRKQAHDLGLVMEDELIDQGVVLTDNIDKLKRSFQAARNEAIAPIIGVMVTLTDKFLGQNSAVKDLDGSVNSLVGINKEYKQITEQLKKPTDDLTEAEKNLLIAQKARLELETNRVMVELGRNYSNVVYEIEQLQKKEKGYQKTINESNEFLSQYTEEQLNEIRNYKQQGRTITDMSIKKAELLRIEGNLEDAQLGLIETQIKLNDRNDDFNTSLVQIAQAVIDGQIEIKTLENINKEFANAVSNTIVKVEEETESIEANTDANKENVESNNALVGADKARQKALDDANEIIQTNIKYEQELADWHTEQKRRAYAAADAMRELAISKDEDTEATDENLKQQGKYTQDYIDAYRQMYFNDRENFIAATSEKAQAFRDAGLDQAEVAKWVSEQIKKYDEENAEQSWIEENIEEWEAWAGIASQSIDTVSNMIEDFNGDTISQIGSVVKQMGEQTGDATTVAAGAVIELGGQIISFFDDMEERNRIWAENMKFLSYDVAQTEMDNKKMSLDYQYEQEQEHLDKLENLAIQAAIDRLSEEEQQELKAQGFIHETKMERLRRELEEAKENNEEEQASVLENAIEIQSIRDDFTTQREEAEKEYNKKIAQYEHDKAILDKQIAISQAEIAKNKAIADLGWFNWNKKDEVRGLYSELIGAIESTPLPPIPSFDVGSIRVPETTQAIVHKNEMILTAPQAEQARSEGVTISPTGGGQTIHLVVELDGKVIGESTLDKINSGQLGKISTRIVK